MTMKIVLFLLSIVILRVEGQAEYPISIPTCTDFSQKEGCMNKCGCAWYNDTFCDNLNLNSSIPLRWNHESCNAEAMGLFIVLLLYLVGFFIVVVVVVGSLINIVSCIYKIISSKKKKRTDWIEMEIKN